MDIKLIQGDCLERLKELEDNSIDSVVTDPPAGISFMNKKWDDKGGLNGFQEFIYQVFKEVYRVMKPGAHGLVWALPRTSHHTAMGLERAGLEIRDCVYHVFGTGFSKGMNIGKAIDKIQGNEREIVGISKGVPDLRDVGEMSKEVSGIGKLSFGQNPRPALRRDLEITKGNTEWEGWGTTLKPAVECWWLVRKPISERTIAQNVLKWRTGGINIDESRIPLSQGEDISIERETKELDTQNQGWGFKAVSRGNEGRFPANLIHDGSPEVLEHFPTTNDSVARFFYCSKASSKERNEGLEGFKEKERVNYGGFHSEEGLIKNNRNPENRKLIKNNHPTVKSLKLMKYLINLITPKQGIVLDPFMGSGSTGVAAKQLGFDFIGIELEEEYFNIAKARIENINNIKSTQLTL